MIVFIILQMILVYWYIRCNNDAFQEIDRGFKESLAEQMKAENTPYVDYLLCGFTIERGRSQGIISISYLKNPIA
ncbi:MAG: hypothetical protein GX053_01560 [Tissierella sp.]|nr:hypothetical protein [Tissierella sp.]